MQWWQFFIMIVNMSKYDKIIHITNMDDYKKVCDKLDKMWYMWNRGKEKLTVYKNYCLVEWTVTLYTYIGEKWVFYWGNNKEAISASKFLNVYDL